MSTDSPKLIRLQPPLIPPDSLESFTSTQRLEVATSSRSNSFAVFASPSSIQNKIPNTDSTIWFGQWDRVSEADVPLYTDAYIDFQGLQQLAFQMEAEKINPQSSQNMSNCYRVLGCYVDHLFAHVDRLLNAEPFPEAAYTHWVEVLATFQLFQTCYTTASGNTNGLFIEEYLYWLNVHYVEPRSEDLNFLATQEKPWKTEQFWDNVIKCALRGIVKSAAQLLSLLQSHPSSSLRRIVQTLIPLLEKYPRSVEFATESEFFSTHRSWNRELERLRQELDMLHESDKPSQEDTRWRNGLETLFGVLAGDKNVIMEFCEKVDWELRDAIGAWGLWVDIRLKREDLPTAVSLILKSLPADPESPCDLLQTAILSFENPSVVNIARDWDLWLAAHMADVMDKLEEVIEDDVGDGMKEAPATEFSKRTETLLAFAEHLHSDPSLWELTLDYVGACGYEGQQWMKELLVRVSLRVERKPPPEGEVPETIELDWGKWEEKVEKVIKICKDYGLKDEISSVCKSVARTMLQMGHYGRAIEYFVHAGDGRGIGRVADLLLDEYITKGPEAFRAHINSIPPHCRPIDNNPNDNLLSRLRFPLWYADFHEMFAAGDKEAAAKLLIGILNSGWVPRWWWGIILIDAGGLLQDEALLVSAEDAQDLLRHLEEIYIRAEQGSREDYLGALEKMIGAKKGKDQPDGTQDALRQLEIVRLALARYLARCVTIRTAGSWVVVR